MKIKIDSCNKVNEGYEIKVQYIDIFSMRLYPDGKGGQLGDRGEIGGIKILKVLDDKIVLEKEIIPGIHEYKIDMERRKDISIQHSAEHLFSGVAKEKFNLNNVGFRMTETVTTIDLDSNEISDEVCKKLIEEINLVIDKGEEIKTEVCSIGQARERYLRKPISTKIQNEDIRIVKIGDYDVCACAGFHAKDVKDIKFVKLVSKEVKGKNTRFSILAGKRAIEDYELKSEIITSLNHKFSCRDGEILFNADKQSENLEKLKKDFNELSQNYAKILYENLEKEIIEISDEKFVILEEKKEVLSAIKKIFEKDLTLIGITSESVMLVSSSLNCGELINKIKKTNPSLKGGGKEKQGNIKGTFKKEEIIEVLKKILLG